MEELVSVTWPTGMGGKGFTTIHQQALLVQDITFSPSLLTEVSRIVLDVNM